MPKLKITVSEKVTYSDSSGRKYSGPLKDAPDYVKDAAKEMNDLLQSIDETVSTLLRRGVSTRSYKMTIGESFSWTPIIGVIIAILVFAMVLLFKFLLGE